MDQFVEHSRDAAASLMPPIIAALWIGGSLLVVFIMGRLFLAFGHRPLLLGFALNFAIQILTLPFAFDDRNRFSVGVNFQTIIRTLPEASFLYVLLNCLFLLVFYFSLDLFRRRQTPPTGLVFEGCYKAIAHGGFVTALIVLQGLMVAVMLYAGVRFGGGIYDILKSPVLRPLANFWSIFSIFAIVFALVRAWLVRTPRTIIEAGLAIVFSAVTGQRGVTLIPIAIAVLGLLRARNSRAIFSVMLVAALLVPAALLQSNLRRSAALDDARSAGASPVLTSIESAAFSNNFSDVRDFAWVLSAYNGVPLKGQTYVAGYTAFVPSVLLPFRTEWGFGTFTARTAGLDPTRTGGLRTGLFSEAYFNFGLFAAVIIAVLFGLVTAQAFAKELRRDEFITTPLGWAANGLATYFLFSIYCSIIFTPSFFYVLVTLFVLLAAHFMFNSSVAAQEGWQTAGGASSP